MSSGEPVRITYLEMRSPVALNPCRARADGFWVYELAPKCWRRNREFYFAVGADWSWTDKRSWSEAEWKDYAESDRLRTFIATCDGADAGYYELRADQEGGVEIAIFGLLPDFIGRGLGGLLLTHALREAWKVHPIRVWLHTCTMDHPAALRNYLARGLVVYRIEDAVDSDGLP